MQIACPACKKVLSVDESKLPPKPVLVKCPACGSGIPVGPPPHGAQAAAPPPLPSEPPAGASTEGPAQPNHPEIAPGSPQWERLKREVAAEVLRQLGLTPAKASLNGEGWGDEEERERTALVCEDEALFQVAISESLQQLGLKVELATSKAAALSALAHQRYDVVTVDNRFPDDNEGGYQILQAINALAPDARRKMFVAFVSADLSTMDTSSAFILGANLTVSKKDVRRLDKILAQGIRDHERAYRVFYQVEEEIQKQEG
ncbi:MAG: response regulator [Acidobacteriota bacterium]